MRRRIACSANATDDKIVKLYSGMTQVAPRRLAGKIEIRLTVYQTTVGVTLQLEWRHRERSITVHRRGVSVGVASLWAWHYCGRGITVGVMSLWAQTVA